MKLMGWGIGFATLLILTAVFFPLISPQVTGRRAAYQRVLGFHTVGKAPQHHKQIPFLYLSWFPKGDPRHADESMVYADKTMWGRRVLWDFAIEGGGSETRDLIAFQALRHAPVLPEGLQNPDAVEYSDLLIVSQVVGGQWSTQYYNRKHLPVEVQKLQGLMTAAAS